MPTRGEAGGVPSGTELYYSFDYGRTHFICLDSQVSGRKKEGAQYRWLKADLEQIRDDQTDWIIAYWHHSPYTHGTHNSDKEREHIEMREVFLPLLEAHGVDLTFGGHSHTYERSILMHGHYGKSDTYDPQQHALDAGDGRPAGDGSYRQSQHAPPVVPFTRWRALPERPRSSAHRIYPSWSRTCPSWPRWWSILMGGVWM